MKVYLDNCALQRPLDSQTQIRIALEAEAVIGPIGLVEGGVVDLVSSEVLDFEVRRNPRPERRAYALAVLTRAENYVQLDDTIESRAITFESAGLKPLDALHLAAAEASEADYFCTTDDGILNRGAEIADLQIRVISPVELITELEQ
jgi:predicted nucleic acid-binding protein